MVTMDDSSMFTRKCDYCSNLLANVFLLDIRRFCKCIQRIAYASINWLSSNKYIERIKLFRTAKTHIDAADKWAKETNKKSMTILCTHHGYIHQTKSIPYHYLPQCVFSFPCLCYWPENVLIYCMHNFAFIEIILNSCKWFKTMKRPAFNPFTALIYADDYLFLLGMHFQRYLYKLNMALF